MSGFLYPRLVNTSTSSSFITGPSCFDTNFPFKSSIICLANFSPTLGNFCKYSIFSLSIASLTPSMLPLAKIGSAILGPSPLTFINFRKSSLSSINLKPNKLYSSYFI